jgi:hypothetical protein
VDKLILRRCAPIRYKVLVGCLVELGWQWRRTDAGWVRDALLQAVSAEGAEHDAGGAVKASDCPERRHYDEISGVENCDI